MNNVHLFHISATSSDLPRALISLFIALVFFQVTLSNTFWTAFLVLFHSFCDSLNSHVAFCTSEQILNHSSDSAVNISSSLDVVAFLIFVNFDAHFTVSIVSSTFHITLITSSTFANLPGSVNHFAGAINSTMSSTIDTWSVIHLDVASPLVWGFLNCWNVSVVVNDLDVWNQ